MRLMDCQHCTNWKCEELTYQELSTKWLETIGGAISPGILKRYKKLASVIDESLDSVRIGYKYCSEGQLTRFYVKRSQHDFKAGKLVNNCPKYSSEHNNGLYLNESSPIWRHCISESHGLTEFGGITFAPGLYEGRYMRVPLYGPYRPIVANGYHECSVCGKLIHRAITVRLEVTFCSNKHYLEWWGQRYREEYQQLNNQ